MEIYRMLHETMWFGIAAQLLINPNMDIVGYKRDVCVARNEFPLNSCVLCQEFVWCDDCPLTERGFSCSAWYHVISTASTPLYIRFHYALRCASVYLRENAKVWLVCGIDNVLKLLSLKTLQEEIKGLASLYEIIAHHIDIDVVQRNYYCDMIKARLVELGEKEGWQNANET